MTLPADRSSVPSVRHSLALLIGIGLVHRFLMVATANNLGLRTNINDLFILALSLGASIGMFYVSYRFRDIRHIRLAWGLLGVGISLVTVGAIIFAFLDTQGLGTFPSIADGFYLAFYPIFGAGLVIMSWSSLSKLNLVKVLMDMAIVMLTALLIFWVVLIAPTLAMEKNASPLTVLIAIAYPIFDWALIFAILRVLYSGPGYTHPVALLLLAFASIGQVFFDAVYLAQALAGTYVPGGWVDTLYVVNFSILLLVISYQLAAQPRGTRVRLPASTIYPQFQWAVYIPNLWAVIAYLLLVWAHNHPLPISFEMLSWIVGGILGLVVTRQIVAVQENTRLGRELQAELAERRSAEESIRKLNEELEGRVLERTTALTQEIAERKQLEAEREKLIIDLEAKNNELERFTYTVSHDLKAPFITIKGFIGFLEQDLAAGNQERVHNDVKRVNEAVDKMNRLLRELLELSRIGRMMKEPENIPFAELVTEALDLVQGRLDAYRVTVHMGSPLGTQPNLPTVHGDRQRLIEVLQNLIDNAAKYMGDQANPLIEIGQESTSTGHGDPIFFVRDNGIGIGPEHHERIFGLFNKLDPTSDGTGIGLALVKRIIEVHGGRIWVESEAGKGSTFYFTLPAGKPDTDR